MISLIESVTCMIDGLHQDGLFMIREARGERRQMSAQALAIMVCWLMPLMCSPFAHLSSDPIEVGLEYHQYHRNLTLATRFAWSEIAQYVEVGRSRSAIRARI